MSDPGQANPSESVIRCVYENTTDIFLMTAARMAQQRRFRKLRLLARVGLPAFLISIALLIASRGELLKGAFFLFVALVLAFESQISSIRLRRAFEKSPFKGETVSISLDTGGLRIINSSSDSKMAWSERIEAVEFIDGVLLLEESIFCCWLPFSSLTAGSSAASLLSLIQSKVRKYRTCGVRPNPLAKTTTQLPMP